MNLYLIIVSILFLVTLTAGVVLGLLLRKRTLKWLKEYEETTQILSANQTVLYKEIGKLKAMSQKQSESISQILKDVNLLVASIQSGKLTAKLIAEDKGSLLSRMEKLKEELSKSKKQCELFKEMAAAASLQSKGLKLGTNRRRNYQDQQRSMEDQYL